MNNNQWMTDRLPNFYDGGIYGKVRVKDDDNVVSLKPHSQVRQGQPWMKIDESMSRYDVTTYRMHYAVFDWKNSSMVAFNLPNREAAERIAAIYEEMMP